MLSEETLTLGSLDDEIRLIEEIVGHKFSNHALMLNALTRRSFWHENRDTCHDHNERLEFLGDAVLGLVVADMLFQLFPEDEEGDLQKKRASLVNRTALARLMRNLGLAMYIRMGRGDEISGCRERDSILSDTLEALIAAVYADAGFEGASEVIRKHFLPLVEKCAARWRLEDCKSILQERAQAHFGITPTYEVVDQWGEEHCKTFSVAVCFGEDVVGIGIGRNKREAAQNAAREALDKIEFENV